jgi:hypothetical protein
VKYRQSQVNLADLIDSQILLLPKFELKILQKLWCGEWYPSAFNSFELPSWMLYQDVQLLWDSGLVRGESGYSL